MGQNLSRQTEQSDAEKKAAAERLSAQIAAQLAAVKESEQAAQQAAAKAAQQAADAKQSADELQAREKALAAQRDADAAALAAQQAKIKAENIIAHNESNTSRGLVKQPFTTMDSTNNKLYFTPYTIQYYNINIIIEIALYIFFLIILYFIIHKLMKLKRNYGR